MARKKTNKSLQQVNGKLKTSKSAKKPATKSTKKIEQIHGKIEEDTISSTVRKSKALDQILGIRQNNPFKCDNLSDFEESLRGKNLTDLREIAVSAGIFPSGNPTILRKKLIKGFQDFMKGGGRDSAPIPVDQPSKFPNSEKQARINDIWSNKK
tara:strand:- start:64 stop:525 length:462 start_codon:yes stop_codon:yes gene_type:complete